MRSWYAYPRERSPELGRLTSLTSPSATTQETLSVSRVSQTLDRISATFDDENLVANAGLLLPATLVEQLDVEAVINSKVRLDGRVGGASPGRKVLTLMNTMLAGGTRINHADMLRAGATEAVVSHRVMAPSTLGTFLRSFTFGHVASSKQSTTSCASVRGRPVRRRAHS